MFKAVLTGCVSTICLAATQPLAHAAIYQQDFEGYTSGQGIGSINNPGGTNSSEAVSTVADHAGSLGWQFFAGNQNGQRFRAYDTFATPLTQDDSFGLSFWIHTYAKANSSENIGFVGLFDSTSTGGSTNGLASMKHFIGVNLGGRGSSNIDPAYNFVVDATGGSFKEHVDTAVIAGGLGQWYQVAIDYNATTRHFTYLVTDEAETEKIAKSYTLPAGVTFQVDAFGGSNGNASDGRSMGVYVDDVGVVPEPSSLGLIGCAALATLSRRRG